MASLCKNPRQNSVFGYIIENREMPGLWLSWIEVLQDFEWREEHQSAHVFFHGQNAQERALQTNGKLVELIGRTV